MMTKHYCGVLIKYGGCQTSSLRLRAKCIEFLTVSLPNRLYNSSIAVIGSEESFRIA